MKVYIAGSSEKRELAGIQALQDIVRGAGHVIPADWTVCEGLKRDCSPAERRQFARNDLDGVRECDVFWLVVPSGQQDKTEGAFLELGYAMAFKKRCIVSGPQARRVDRLFCLLCEVYDTHEAALEQVIGKPIGGKTIGGLL